MSEKTWIAVDDYIADRLLPPDPILETTLTANAQGGLPPIDVSPAQGQFLQLLARIVAAKSILEIGTLGGYSTICLARGLAADGKLITLERSAKHAEVAEENIRRAGLADRVTIHVGAAAETLPKLAADGAGPFDLVFIDADKPGNPVYLDWAVKLSRPGTVIVLDNVIRDGKVIRENSGDANVEGARQGFDFLGSHPRLNATALQTVGAKGYDGFALAVVE